MTISIAEAEKRAASLIANKNRKKVFRDFGNVHKGVDRDIKMMEKDRKELEKLAHVAEKRKDENSARVLWHLAKMKLDDMIFSNRLAIICLNLQKLIYIDELEKTESPSVDRLKDLGKQLEDINNFLIQNEKGLTWLERFQEHNEPTENGDLAF